MRLTTCNKIPHHHGNLPSHSPKTPHHHGNLESHSPITQRHHPQPSTTWKPPFQCVWPLAPWKPAMPFPNNTTPPWKPLITFPNNTAPPSTTQHNLEATIPMRLTTCNEMRLRRRWRKSSFAKGGREPAADPLYRRHLRLAGHWWEQKLSKRETCRPLGRAQKQANLRQRI